MCNSVVESSVSVPFSRSLPSCLSSVRTQPAPEVKRGAGHEDMDVCARRRGRSAGGKNGGKNDGGVVARVCEREEEQRGGGGGGGSREEEKMCGERKSNEVMKGSAARGYTHTCTLTCACDFLARPVQHETCEREERGWRGSLAATLAESAAPMVFIALHQ